MDPCRQYDSLPVGYLLWDTGKVGDYQHVDIVSRKRLAQDGLSHLVPVIRHTCLADVFTVVSVRMGLALREVDRVLVVLGCVLEGQTVVLLAIPVVGGLQG